MPSDIDEQCVDLCNLLNRLPFVETIESCAGHSEHPYWVFFKCVDIGVLSRLGRSVERNYSDGNWEIIVDSCDIDPYGMFWLRTKSILKNDQLNESLKHLIENIEYWFNDAFDNVNKTQTSYDAQNRVVRGLFFTHARGHPRSQNAACVNSDGHGAKK